MTLYEWETAFAAGGKSMANSRDRREARYQRRRAQREQKAQEAGGASFDEVMSFGNLCKAGKE